MSTKEQLKQQDNDSGEWRMHNMLKVEACDHDMLNVMTEDVNMRDAVEDESVGMGSYLLWKSWQHKHLLEDILFCCINLFLTPRKYDMKENNIARCPNFWVFQEHSLDIYSF